MDKLTHFLLILAAILVILYCAISLAGTVCLWGHAHRIRKDIDKLFQDIEDLAKLAKKFLGGLTEDYTSIRYDSQGYPPENDDRHWRHASQFHYPYFE